MKRTFIAVKVDACEKLADATAKIRSQLKNESVRWVDLNQVHITLAFLGDTSEESIRDVSSMIAEKCHDFGKIEFMIKGIGVFRNLKDPRVIWAGIANSERLTELSELIKGGLDNLDIVTGDRKFQPHLTLVRARSIKDQGSLRTLLSEYENVEFQKGEVSEVIYFESILRQTGPLYLPLKKIRL